jgi:polyribonucleotide nucleotidyltransferase
LTDALNTKKVREAGQLSSRRRQEEGSGAIPEEQKEEAGKLFDALKERIFRDEMLKDRRRPDGRKFDEIRNIECEVGVLPRTHGSALFTRGETQALVTVTLGTKDDEQRIEMLDSPKPPSASCCITTSRRSAWAKWDSCAARAGARSGTAL